MLFWLLGNENNYGLTRKEASHIGEVERRGLGRADGGKESGILQSRVEHESSGTDCHNLRAKLAGANLGGGHSCHEGPTQRTRPHGCEEAFTEHSEPTAEDHGSGVEQIEHASDGNAEVLGRFLHDLIRQRIVGHCRGFDRDERGLTLGQQAARKCRT